MNCDLRIRFEVESPRSSRWLRLLGPRSDPHHLVAAAPELVLDGLNGHVMPPILEVSHTRLDKRRSVPAQRDQREDTDFGGYAAHFLSCRAMKHLVELTGLEKDEV
jgi:hypothetical protein